MKDECKDGYKNSTAKRLAKYHSEKGRMVKAVKCKKCIWWHLEFTESSFPKPNMRLKH